MSIASCGHVKMVFQKPGSGIKGELCWLVEGECSSDNSNPAPPATPPPHPAHQGIKDTTLLYLNRQLLVRSTRLKALKI